ncbi:MAG: carbamoyltransferase HypF [Gaiellales bacterium]
MSETAVRERRRLEVHGAVQGVGFRPFAYRLATELGLGGFAGNDPAGAFVEIEGPAEALALFARRLVLEAPPLARIETVTTEGVAPRGESSFSIAETAHDATGTTLIPPDTATCPACLAEITDPSDRRYRHPFANCTDCGPRFTIIHELPYDRPATTMAGFPLCRACAAEYGDPGDRRYHAQPISCPDCGPTLRFAAGGREVVGTDSAIAAVHEVWATGGVVAVKGIGGYHLTCDARNETAVARLRERKGRVGKPFAVMARDLDAAEALAALGAAARVALLDPASPIVLAPRRRGALLAAGVAPGLAEVGVMLAYTPLHRLLLEPVPGASCSAPQAIVATSGNRGDEPICTDDAEARTRLGALADAFLIHDREIAVPCDDSVVRVTATGVQPLRRSRGYAPLPVSLPFDVPPLLAVGGELKNTFCLADRNHAWLSQHIGDLGTLETVAAFERSLARLSTILRLTPAVVATDAHPGYLSRRWAERNAREARIVEVQHHHAHVASLMAEHGLPRDAEIIGVAFDGTGYGASLDGGVAAWGGEILVAGYERFRRAFHLAELPLPGGDAGVRSPCRVALAFLLRCGLDPIQAPGLVETLDDIERGVVTRQVETGAGIVPTTSAGRLFDAVASLLGVRQRVTYEGQAAMELEALAASASCVAALELEVTDAGAIDPTPLFREILAQLGRGADPAGLALGFHHALADAIAGAAGRASEETGIGLVGLTGGVFQNVLLGGLCRERLQAGGLDVLEHRLVPANDGGLALGQAVVAAARIDTREGS